MTTTVEPAEETMPEAPTTDTVENKRIGTLARYITHLQAIQALFDAGKIEEAREKWWQGPYKHVNSLIWSDDIRQEMYERETPVLDLRAHVLAEVERLGHRNWRGGTDPTDLLRTAGDRRINRVTLEPVIQALIEEGVLVMRQKKLWTPEEWRRHLDARTSARSSTAARGGKPSIFRY